MSRFMGFLMLFWPLALCAQPLRVATVGAPAINCMFNPTCKVTVQDLSATIWTSGFLQSRNYRAAPRSQAHGNYVYEYRIDLRNVVGVTSIPFITSLTVNIGPTIPYDFNGDGRPDDVFVVTSGGLGNVGLASAVRSGNNIQFNFTSGVGGGSSRGRGDSSFFFGVVSASPRHNVTASAPNSLGPALSLNAWAPAHP
jgi:hypothetical protein